MPTLCHAVTESLLTLARSCLVRIPAMFTDFSQCSEANSGMEPASTHVMISFDATLTSGMTVSAAVCQAGCLVGQAAVASRSGEAGNYGQHVMQTVVGLQRP